MILVHFVSTNFVLLKLNLLLLAFGASQVSQFKEVIYRVCLKCVVQDTVAVYLFVKGSTAEVNRAQMMVMKKNPTVSYIALICYTRQVNLHNIL